jgi:DNA-binding transcriptional ArsR family regulator
MKNTKSSGRLSGGHADDAGKARLIRSMDVAEQLHVTKPSVTYTTKRLRENGYITMDRDGLITLTDSGMEIARPDLYPAQAADGILRSSGSGRRDRPGGRLQGGARRQPKDL